MRISWLLGLLPTLGPVAFACGGSGSLPEPISTKQITDPNDPGTNQSTGSFPPVDAGQTPLTLPGGAAGIGFGEIRYAADLSAILVPGAGTGNLNLVDPSSERVTTISGFSGAGAGAVGIGSADQGQGMLYVVDRSSLQLSIVDGMTHQIVASAQVASAPGVVRYVAPTNEVWVTEPADRRVEVFTLGAPGTTSPPVHASFIAVGGADALEIDPASQLAFTSGGSTTYTIGVASHMVTTSWSNGCQAARGMAVDRTHGWLMVGCSEGAAIVLDEHSGAVKGKVTTGSGVDGIAYDAARLRLYVPAPGQSLMAVISLGPTSGAPSVKGALDIPPDAHCAATEGGGTVYVCVPSKGQLSYVRDPF